MILPGKRSQRAFITLLLFIAATRIGAAELKVGGVTLTLPNQTASTWILNNVRKNGVETDMLGLTFYLPLDAVRQHFIGQLQQAGQFREETIDDWLVLSQKRQDRFISLQLRSQDFGAIGMLTCLLYTSDAADE